jgi:hypothetical protein
MGAQGGVVEERQRCGGAMPAARSSSSLSARSSQWQEEWGRCVSDMEEVPRLGSKEQRRDRHGGGEAGRLVGLCFFNVVGSTYRSGVGSIHCHIFNKCHQING